MPVANSLLLDTTAVIAFLRNEPRAVTLLRQMDVLYLPLISLGELYLGIERAQDRQRGERQLNELLSFINVLYPDNATAAMYGAIKAQLLNQGTPIPDNDIWIAATARQADLSLAARDKHFSYVAGLHVETV